MSPYARDKNIALRNSVDFKYQLYYDDSNSGSAESLFNLFGENLFQFRDEDITWCQQPEYNQPAAAMLCYGNDPWMEVWYKAAVILIGIPIWSECRQQLVMQSEGSTQSGSSVQIEVLRHVLGCLMYQTSCFCVLFSYGFS